MSDSVVQAATYRGIPVLEHSGASGEPLTAITADGSIARLQTAVKAIADHGGDPDGLQVLTAAAATAVITESGGIIKKSVITLDAHAVTVDGTSGAGWGGALVATFPVGLIKIHAISMTDMLIDPLASNLEAADGGDISLGTTDTEDNTLDGTDVNLMASTSLDPIGTGVDGVFNGASFDGTAAAVEINVNVLIDDGDIAAAEAIGIDGVITVFWSYLGNDA